MASGVYLRPQSRFCLSLAHTDDEGRTVERFDEALETICRSKRD